jgi:hypothetical protein
MNRWNKLMLLALGVALITNSMHASTERETIIVAAQTGDLQTIKNMIGTMTQDDKSAALYVAAGHGQDSENIVDFLLAEQTEGVPSADVNWRPSAEYTKEEPGVFPFNSPLGNAIWGSRRNIILKLIDAGADYQKALSSFNFSQDTRDMVKDLLKEHESPKSKMRREAKQQKKEARQAKRKMRK